MSKTVRLQTIHFSIQKLFNYKQFSLALVLRLNVKTVLFQIIQFSISTEFSSIWPIDRILSGATTPSQWTWEQWHEGVHCILQGSIITGTSPSDCLVLYQGSWWWDLTPQQKSSRCIQQPQPRGQLIICIELNGLKMYSCFIIKIIIIITSVCDSNCNFSVPNNHQRVDKGQVVTLPDIRMCEGASGGVMVSKLN